MIYYLEFLLTPTFPALHLLSIFLGSIYWYGLCTEMCSTDPGLARMFHELLSRDHEDGCASGQPSRGTAGLVRGVPEWYVAGADTRGRQEGRPYPWSQQVIREISGLRVMSAPAAFEIEMHFHLHPVLPQ